MIRSSSSVSGHSRRSHPASGPLDPSYRTTRTPSEADAVCQKETSLFLMLGVCPLAAIG
jgi:hypothetical protein